MNKKNLSDTLFKIKVNILGIENKISYYEQEIERLKERKQQLIWLEQDIKKRLAR